jgi:hypothetical protein
MALPPFEYTFCFDTIPEHNMKVYQFPEKSQAFPLTAFPLTEFYIGLYEKRI